MRKPELKSVTGELPEPPYPAKTRVRGWRFQLNHETMTRRKEWRLAPRELRPWILYLWWEAWQEQPAGSFENDDDVIASAIEMEPRMFSAHRDVLLRGWELHSDGRLYHPVVVEQVLEYLGMKRETAERVRKFRSKGKAKKEDESNALVTACNALHGVSNAVKRVGNTHVTAPEPEPEPEPDPDPEPDPEKKDTPQTPQGGHAPETPPAEAHEDRQPSLPAEPSETKTEVQTVENPPQKPKRTRRKTAEKKATAKKSSGKTTKFVKPTLEEVAAYLAERGSDIDPQHYLDVNESKGWVVGRSNAPMQNWKSNVNVWISNNRKWGAEGGGNGNGRRINGNGKTKEERARKVEEMMRTLDENDYGGNVIEGTCTVEVH